MTPPPAPEASRSVLGPALFVYQASSVAIVIAISIAAVAMISSYRHGSGGGADGRRRQRRQTSRMREQEEEEEEEAERSGSVQSAHHDDIRRERSFDISDETSLVSPHPPIYPEVGDDDGRATTESSGGEEKEEEGEGLGAERSSRGRIARTEQEEGSEEENNRLRLAIQSKNRDEIRAIMTARNAREARHCGGPSGDGKGNDKGDDKDAEANIAEAPALGVTDISSPYSAGDASRFSCPICLQLLYKPCIGTCGHAFCFWCLHFTMSGVQSSSCPLCRNPFTQFASILAPLHRFLLREFPSEMERRKEEVRSEEQDKLCGTRAPDVDEDGPASVGDVVDRDIRMIGSVDVLDMLCVMCQNVVSDPVVPACGHLICKACIVPGSSGGGISGHKDAPCCPECQTPMLDGLGGKAGELAVCSVLEPLLARIKDADEMTIGTAVEKAKRGKNVAGDQTRSNLPENKLSTGIASTSENSDESADIASYVHMGVGCDGCGVFPIIGRAFRCLDCPEEVGFDLCLRCYSRGLHLRVSTGRFNQSHEASHNMEERGQIENILHILKRSHPGLTTQQIMQLVEMQLGFGIADIGVEEEGEEDESSRG